MSFSFTSLHDRTTLESMTDIVAQLSCWSVLKTINTTTWLLWSPFAIRYLLLAYAKQITDTLLLIQDNWTWNSSLSIQSVLYPAPISTAQVTSMIRVTKKIFFAPRYKMGSPSTMIKKHHSTYSPCTLSSCFPLLLSLVLLLLLPRVMFTLLSRTIVAMISMSASWPMVKARLPQKLLPRAAKPPILFLATGKVVSGPVTSAMVKSAMPLLVLLTLLH